MARAACAPGAHPRGLGSPRVVLHPDVAAGGHRIDPHHRIPALGRRVRLLEINTTTDTLLVFSRWDLGGDPLDVLDALTEAGYTAAIEYSGR